MEHKSFTIGIRYIDEHDEPYIIMRKIWVAGPDALILNLRANESSMNTEYELIDTTFNSVKVTPAEALADAITDPIPYTVPMGMGQEIIPLQELDSEGLPLSSILLSAGLALFAVIMIFFAYKINKSKAAEAAKDQNP